MPRRKRSRLRDFDYAIPGAYFVTICAHRREEIFGCCIDGELRPTPAGLVIGSCWDQIPAHFPAVALDAFVLMPNHLHGILLLGEGGVALPTVVGAFKSAASKQIKAMRTNVGRQVWQRGYYDHIVRSEEELEAIRRYVVENLAAWTADPENPSRTAMPMSAPWL